MIEICTEDSSIVIKPLDTSSLADAVRIYNSGSDARYATGLEGNLSIQELSSLIERTEACNNEFLAGIYIKSHGTTAAGLATTTAAGTTAGLATTTTAGIAAALQFSGLLSGIIDSNAVWIKQLSILPENRRKGIGTRAAEILLKYVVRSQNVQDAYLSVVEKNSAGLCFWRKLGFCEVRMIEKVLFGEDCPYNVVIMRKSL